MKFIAYEKFSIIAYERFSPFLYFKLFKVTFNSDPIPVV